MPNGIQGFGKHLMFGSPRAELRTAAYARYSLEKREKPNMILQTTVLVFSVTYVHSSGRGWQYLVNVCFAVSCGEILVRRRDFFFNKSLILAAGN